MENTGNEVGKKIKENLDHYHINYTSKYEDRAFCMEYNDSDFDAFSGKIFLNVIVKENYYLCIAMFGRMVSESVRAEVSQYIMRVNWDSLYDTGVFLMNISDGAVCYRSADTNPDNVIEKIIYSLVVIERILLGFSAVNTGILSAEQADTMRKNTPSDGKNSIAKFFSALQKGDAVSE